MALLPIRETTYNVYALANHLDQDRHIMIAGRNPLSLLARLLLNNEVSRLHYLPDETPVASEVRIPDHVGANGLVESINEAQRLGILQVDVVNDDGGISLELDVVFTNLPDSERPEEF